ncbi:astacin [Ostertagia ostertagi]
MGFLILCLILAAWVSVDSSILNPEWRTEFLGEQKFSKREAVDGAQPLGDSIEEVNTRRGVAAKLFQGDIVLSKEQKDQIAEGIRRARPKRQAFNDKTFPALKWSKGVAYMLWDYLDEETKTSFKKAAQLWMDDTCVNFTEYTVDMIKRKKPEHYLVVVKGEGCSSDLGRRVKEGPQYLSLAEGCETVCV